MTALLDSLFAHCSVRNYQDKPVEDEKLNNIIRAVQAAPNWVNFQHVSVIVVKDAARKQRLMNLCGNQPYVAQAPVFLVFCADFYRTQLACQKHGVDLRDILDDPDLVLVGTEDVGIALGTAVIAAEAQGLGTVPIGDVRMNAKALIQELALPEFVFPVLGLCVGYSAETNVSQHPRLPPEAVFFNEKYNAAQAEFIENFDRTYTDYLSQRSGNNRVSSWSNEIAEFYKPPYQHYPETAEMLIQQGFKFK